MLGNRKYVLSVKTVIKPTKNLGEIAEKIMNFL